MNYPGSSADHEDLIDQFRKPPLVSDQRSTTATYSFLALIIAYYVYNHLGQIYFPLSEILWNALVWITPFPLLSMLDKRLESPSKESQQDANMNVSAKTHASKSNAIRRILGLDGAGILTNVQRARTLSNLSGVFKGGASDRLAGLGNWDNSCYQNSVLQGLAALKSMPKFLDQIATSNASQSTSNALQDTIARLNDITNAGKTFWTPSELKSMSSWQQQDAQEYYSKLSGELEKDLAQSIKAKAALTRLEEMTDIEQKTRSPVISNEIENPESDSGLELDLSKLPDEIKYLIAHNPLEGLLAQRVGCQRCGHVEGLSLVPFNCLTVPLGKDWMYDIRTCLDDYTALEPINGVECARCTLLQAKHRLAQMLFTIKGSNYDKDRIDPGGTTDTLVASLEERCRIVDQALEEEDFSDQALKKCKIPSENRVSTTKTRQAVIARTPQSLVIHVNRSNFDELTGVQSKNLAKVSFPRRLDLGPWCLGHPPGMERADNDTESWNTNPSESMLSDYDIDSDWKYELRAVITHYGRHENGHYICYRRSPYLSEADEKGDDGVAASWWRLSDEDVTEVDEDFVLAQGGVFMLFYELIDTPVPPAKELPAPAVGHKEDVRIETLQAERIVETENLEDSGPPQDYPASDPVLNVQSVSSDHTLPMAPQASTTISSDTGPVNSTEESAPWVNSDLTQNTTDPGSSPILDISQPNSTIVSGSAPISPINGKQIPPVKPTQPSHDQPEQSAQVSVPKETQPVSPLSMRTAAPRNSRAKGSRAGKAMGSVAGFVQAN